MGYLDNSVITVDAILTKAGRQALANGTFNITQFALADDEIDYSLYNVNHPSGSAYYGEAIENMPLLEAFMDGQQDVKYKLVTLERGTNTTAVISTGATLYTVNVNGRTPFTPKTLNYESVEVTEPEGYSVRIQDSRFIDVVGFGAASSQTATQNVSYAVGSAPQSKTVNGTTFEFRGKAGWSGARPFSTTATITGNSSGASYNVQVTLIPSASTTTSTI